MSDTRKDVVIIGSGPAGLSAGGLCETCVAGCGSNREGNVQRRTDCHNRPCG